MLQRLIMDGDENGREENSWPSDLGLIPSVPKLIWLSVGVWIIIIRVSFLFPVQHVLQNSEVHKKVGNVPFKRKVDIGAANSNLLATKLWAEWLKLILSEPL